MCLLWCTCHSCQNRSHTYPGGLPGALIFVRFSLIFQYQQLCSKRRKRHPQSITQILFYSTNLGHYHWFWWVIQLLQQKFPFAPSRGKGFYKHEWTDKGTSFLKATVRKVAALAHNFPPGPGVWVVWLPAFLPDLALQRSITDSPLLPTSVLASPQKRHLRLKGEQSYMPNPYQFH